MELKLYLDVLKRRALVIVLVTAVAVSLMTGAGLLVPAEYTASATVRVLLDVGIADFRIWEDSANRLLKTYTHILMSGPTLEEAIDRLMPRSSSLTVKDLRECVQVEIIPGTELISIAVQNEDPGLARDVANTLANLLMEYAQDLYVGSSKSTLQIVEEQLASMENDIEDDRQRLAALVTRSDASAEIETLRSQIEFKEDAYDRLLDRYELARLNESLQANSVTVVEPAALPFWPSNSLGLTQIALSGIVGLFVGVGLVLVLENLDTRIHSPQQLEHMTNLPILGIAPKGILSPDELEQPNENRGCIQSIEEAYRLLGINLQALGEKNALKTILITSAVPREGKSMTAANLAQVLAERGQTVFLVESDLRSPALTKMLELENDGYGLGSLLVDRPPNSREVLGKVMLPTKQPTLFAVVAGPKVTNPTSLLTSPLMEKILSYLAEQGQVTLLDAPPVLGMADVSVLAPKADGIILVVRESYSKRDQVLAALKQLEASRARVLGFVFLQKNDVDWIYG